MNKYSSVDLSSDKAGETDVLPESMRYEFGIELVVNLTLCAVIAFVISQLTNFGYGYSLFSSLSFGVTMQLISYALLYWMPGLKPAIRISVTLIAGSLFGGWVTLTLDVLNRGGGYGTENVITYFSYMVVGVVFGTIVLIIFHLIDSAKINNERSYIGYQSTRMQLDSLLAHKVKVIEQRPGERRDLYLALFNIEVLFSKAQYLHWLQNNLQSLLQTYAAPDEVEIIHLGIKRFAVVINSSSEEVAVEICDEISHRIINSTHPVFPYRVSVGFSLWDGESSHEEFIFQTEELLFREMSSS